MTVRLPPGFELVTSRTQSNRITEEKPATTQDICTHIPLEME
jgi:hypothetical protein